MHPEHPSDSPFSLEQLQAVYQSHALELELSVYPDFAGPIYTAQIPGGEAALEIWQKLRQLNTQTGYWPVLTLNHWYEEMADDLQTQSWLQQALEFSPSEYFGGRLSELPNPEEEAEDWEEFAGELGELMEEIDFKAAAESSPSRFSLPYDILSRQPLDKLLLTLVPVRQPWEVAAYLGFGGWNSCPEPAWQVAIQKYWFERYGAEVVSMSSDVLEMQVSRPPQTAAEALALAQEQYLFCDDIVHQGVQTIANLSKSLLNSSIWYFWWD